MTPASPRGRLPYIVAIVLSVLATLSCTGSKKKRTERADQDEAPAKPSGSSGSAASAKGSGPGAASAKPSASAGQVGGGAAAFKFYVKPPRARYGEKSPVGFPCVAHFERAGAKPIDERTTCYMPLEFDAGNLKEVRIGGEKQEGMGRGDNLEVSLLDDEFAKYLELTNESMMSSRVSLVLVYPDGEWKGTITFDTELLRQLTTDLPYGKKLLAKGEDASTPGGPGTLVVADKLAWQHQRVVGGATRLKDVGRVAMVKGKTRVIRSCNYKDASGTIQSTPLGATDIEIELIERKTARKLAKTTLRASTPAACASSTTKDKLHGSGSDSEVPADKVTAWIDAQAKRK
jgi:hypothetical protein